MQGDGRSPTPWAEPAMRVRGRPDEEARSGRAMRRDGGQEDGRETHGRRHVTRSPSPAMAAEKRRPPTASGARSWPRGASPRWIIQIAPAGYSWYTCRRHEAHSSWSWGLAMVAPQKHNRQPRFVCLASAGAREALPAPRVKGNKKAQSLPVARGQWPTAPSVDSMQIRCQVAAPERCSQSTSCQVGHAPRSLS
jgi:hypothetical protein